MVKESENAPTPDRYHGGALFRPLKQHFLRTLFVTQEDHPPNSGVAAKSHTREARGLKQTSSKLKLCTLHATGEITRPDI